ncbi:hypothetical protein [Streptomyces sp. A5-4]|uniref:hypothetical protein n=1 Tax=Streptomyces sp. A5-4 TaxID=3384771 RepID=UPI003DA80290
MSATTDQVQFAAYAPGRFAEHLPFAQRGYLFTLPGDFPEETPAHTNVTDWEMAVYRAHGEWEVRDINGNRKVWGIGPSRRVAVGMAFQAVARKRRYRAADIADRRAAAGLETVPPYMVEVTAGVTLVLTPQAVAHLFRIEATDFGHPARYHVTDPDGGGAYAITAGEGVELRTLEVGLLHVRCGCDPEATRFENEADALAYIREELSTWAMCENSPGAPAEADAQPDEDDDPDIMERRKERALQATWDGLTDNYERSYQDAQTAREQMTRAGVAMIGQVIRGQLPAATGMSVRAEDLALTAVHGDGDRLWAENGGELPGETVHNVNAYLTDVLTFGRDEEALTDLGWAEDEHLSGVFTIAFPPAP